MTILVYGQLPNRTRYGKVRLTLSTQDQIAHEALGRVPQWELEQILDDCLQAVLKRVKEQPCD